MPSFRVEVANSPRSAALHLCHPWSNRARTKLAGGDRGIGGRPDFHIPCHLYSTHAWTDFGGGDRGIGGRADFHICVTCLQCSRAWTEFA